GCCSRWRRHPPPPRRRPPPPPRRRPPGGHPSPTHRRPRCPRWSRPHSPGGRQRQPGTTVSRDMPSVSADQEPRRSGGDSDLDDLQAEVETIVPWMDSIYGFFELAVGAGGRSRKILAILSIFFPFGSAFPRSTTINIRRPWLSAVPVASPTAARP